MSVISKLLIKLGADSAEFQSGLKKAARQTKTFQAQSRESFDKIAKSAAAMSVAVGAATAVIVQKNLASIDSLAKTADKLGITTEALGGLRHAATLTGVSQQKLDKSLEKMNRSLGDAARGTGEAKKVLEQLGIPIADIINKSPDQAFAKIADEINGLSTQSEKAAAAAAIFGREGVSLLNTLNMGSEGIRATAEEAEALGMTLSRVDAAKVEAANDAMARAGGAITGIGQTLTVQFAPYIEAVANHLVRAAKESGGFKSQITAALKAGIMGAARLADIWRGWELIFAGLKVAFAALGEFILRGFEQWDRAITDTINGAIGVINTLVEGMNRIPGVEIQALGTTEYSDTLANLARSAEEYTAEVSAQFMALASKPIPSDNVKAWLAEVEAAATVAAEKIAAASSGIKGPASGGFGEEEDPASEKQQERLAAQLLALEQSLMTEEERLFDSTVRRAEMVIAAHESALITEARQNELIEALAADHEARLTAIHKKGLSEREKFLAKSTSAQVKDVAGALVEMTQATARENKAMFAINKAASIATAIINTSEGVTKTLAKYPGPVGIALAAVHAAAGAAQIASIMSTSFGSGNVAPSVQATGASDVVATTPASGSEDREPSQVTNIYVQGHVFDIYDTARQLAPEIKRAEGDGINRD